MPPRTLIIKVVHEGSETTSNNLFNVAADALLHNGSIVDVNVMVAAERPANKKERKEYNLDD